VAAEPAVSPVPESAVVLQAPPPAVASDQTHHAITSDWVVPYSSPFAYSEKEMPRNSKPDVSPDVHATIAEDGMFDVHSIISAFSDLPDLSINQPADREGNMKSVSNDTPANANPQSPMELRSDSVHRDSIVSHQRGSSGTSTDYFNSQGSPKQKQPALMQPKPVQVEEEWVPNYGAAFHGRQSLAASSPFNSPMNNPPILTAAEQEHEAELMRFAEEEAALAEAEAEVQRKREELRRRREAQSQPRHSLNGAGHDNTAMANKITNAMPYNDYNRTSRASKASKVNAEAASPLSSASNSPSRASTGQLDSARRSRSGVSWGAHTVIHEDVPLEQSSPIWPQPPSSSPLNAPTAPRFRESFDGPIPHPHMPTPHTSQGSFGHSYDSIQGGPPPQFIGRPVGQTPRDFSNGNQYSYPGHPNFPRPMETAPQIPQRAHSDATQLANDKRLKKERSRSSFSWFGKRNSQVAAH